MDRCFEKASEYLRILCDVKPNRRTGSSGNREATDFFEKLSVSMGMISTPHLLRL